MNFLDPLPLIAVFLVATLVQIFAIEAGFLFGRHKMGKPNKAQMAQVRAIMGASLGLLAFMLAFSFSSAQQHFDERIKALMMEVSAIDTAFRGASLIESSVGTEARTLLHDFSQLRLDTSRAARQGDMEQALEMVRTSEMMHQQLWSMAESVMNTGQASEGAGMFANAVLSMISAHDARIQATFFNRIPIVIWLTLYAMALLSMLIMGYQAGLTGTRSRLATWTLAVTFAAVMTLITDLDRPRMSLFSINDDLMVALNQRLSSAENNEPDAPGQ